MDKKFIIIGGVGLLIIILLIVFLVRGKTTTTTSKTNTMVIWDYKNEKAAYDPVILAYQKMKNIKVQYVVKDPNSYLEDTVNAMAAGNGPDVWIVPANILPQYHDKLYPMPAGGFADPDNKKNDLEVYKDSYPPVVTQDNVINNQIYGVPLTIDSLKLFVNQDLANKALNEYLQTHPNIDISAMSNTISNPTIWDDVVTADHIITTKTAKGDISRSAIALGTSDNIPAATDILTALMMQNGAKMVTDDLGTAQFNTSQNLFGKIQYPGTKALEFYTSFSNPKNANYTWNSKMGNARRAFAEGKVAMLIDYDSAKDEIRNISPNFYYRTLNLPQIKESLNPIDIAQYDTLVVSKTSTMPLIAWRFVLTATVGNYVSSYYAITGKSDNFQDQQVNYCQSWYNPDTIKVQAIFANAIDQAVAGKDTQTAMDGAAGQVTTLLGKLKAQLQTVN